MTEAGGLNSGEESIGKESISESPEIFTINQNWGWKAEGRAAPCLTRLLPGRPGTRWKGTQGGAGRDQLMSGVSDTVKLRHLSHPSTGVQGNVCMCLVLRSMAGTVPNAGKRSSKEDIWILLCKCWTLVRAVLV